MAAPTLSIELNPGPWSDPDWREYFICGGEISGRVRVQCDDETHCRGLRLSMGWHTEGRGDRNEQTVHEATLHEGRLPSGEQSYPFTARIPLAGPASYPGHYINIIWQLTVRLDLAWKFDPSAEKVFYVTLP